MYGMFRSGLLTKLVFAGAAIYGVVWGAGHFMSQANSSFYLFGLLAVGAIVAGLIVYRILIR